MAVGEDVDRTLHRARLSRHSPAVEILSFVGDFAIERLATPVKSGAVAFLLWRAAVTANVR